MSTPRDRLQWLLDHAEIVPLADYLKEIEAGAPLICLPGFGFEFPDNLHGQCAMCRCLIHFRPYNKVATFKVCTGCAPKLKGEVS